MAIALCGPQLSAGPSEPAVEPTLRGVVYEISPDPRSAATMLAVAEAGVYRTLDGGATWAQTLPVDLNHGGGRISRSSANPDVLYFAGLDGRILRSDDGGAQWRLAGQFSEAGIVAADAVNPDVAYFAQPSGLARTDDGGATWHPLPVLMADSTIASLVSSPDGALYLDTHAASAYRSTDRGATWQSISSGLACCGVINGFAVSASNPTVVYRASTDAIYVTHNAGASWTRSGGRLPASLAALAVSPANSSTISAAVFGTPATYVSSDGGATWHAAETPMAVSLTAGRSSYVTPAAALAAMNSRLVAARTGGHVANTPGNLNLRPAGQSATTSYLISTFAGGQLPATGTAATAAYFIVPGLEGVAADGLGNVYLASATMNVVYRVSAGGILTQIAGNGTSGYSGDGKEALNAQFNGIVGLAVDAAGNVYIADANNSRVRVVVPSGLVKTVAGNGTAGSGGDGGQATSAQLNQPTGVALDSLGNLYIADSGANRVRRVATDGTISTFAGTGVAGYSGDTALAVNAKFSAPYAVAVDTKNNVYIVDTNNNRIRKVGTDGNVNTVAGNGFPGNSGDNGQATSASLLYPQGVAVDPDGNIYIADTHSNNVRKVDINGIITNYAGSGSAGALFYYPWAVATDTHGNLYVADTYQGKIEKIASGATTVLAGGAAGDGGPAPFASLEMPFGVAKDANGNVYIADTLRHTVRKVDPAGAISTVAGTGVAGLSGDGSQAILAQLNNPSGLAVDPQGNLYIADRSNSRIRMVDTNGTITTFAGKCCGFGGDNGPAVNALMGAPVGVTVAPDGSVYIADISVNVIRKVTNNTITTVAGIPLATPSYSGDGGPALSANLNQPYGVAVDATGNIYIADTNNSRIRIVTPDHNINTFAGNGTAGFAGDGGAPTAASLRNPDSVVLDANGNLFISDTNNQRIRVVSGNTISTIAGTGATSNPSPAGPALNGSFRNPAQIAVDSAGDVYVADQFNGAVQLLTPTGTAPVLTVASSHVGNLVAGTTGQYTVTVANVASAGQATGTITMTETAPPGMTISSMIGDGWSCDTVKCTLTGTLGAGVVASAITVSVNVSSSAPSQVTNRVAVSGAGAALSTGEDFTFVVVAGTCDLSGDGKTGVVDVQLIVNEALGLSFPSHDLNNDGHVNVVDIQKVINAAMNQGCAI